MPDHSPSTDERASLAQPSQSSSPLECTSHLGFSLVRYRRPVILGYGLDEIAQALALTDGDGETHLLLAPPGPTP